MDDTQQSRKAVAPAPLLQGPGAGHGPERTESAGRCGTTRVRQQERVAGLHGRPIGPEKSNPDLPAHRCNQLRVWPPKLRFLRKMPCESTAAGKKKTEQVVQPLVSGGETASGPSRLPGCQRAPERQAVKLAAAGPWGYVFTCPFTCVIVVDAARYVKQFLETGAVSGGGDWAGVYVEECFLLADQPHSPAGRG